MLTFDDFRIVPRTPSYVESRRTVDTSVALTGLSLAVPVIVPGMKSLVTQALIDNVEAAGGAVAQPRNVIFRAGRPIINVSMNQAENVAASLHGRSILSIEIANGHMSKLGNLVESIKRAHPDRIVWAGTVADARGAKFLAEGGADAIIVGIGVGQACTTTDKTGVGLPLVESLIDIYKSGIQVPIITSGGLRKPADFVKAIALGADACMTGSLVAGCLDTAEAPYYYGEASAKAKQQYGKEVDYIEGKEIAVIQTRTSKEVVIDLKEALQSAMSYCNSTTLKEFRERVQFYPDILR